MHGPSITRKSGRHFLTDWIREEVDWWNTPQSSGDAPPPVQKPPRDGATIIPLPVREAWQISPCDLADAIARRESRRRFLPEPLSLAELAFLLWSTQGVRAQLHEAAVLRTVPSAGCRHPFETYLVVLNIETLGAGTCAIAAYHQELSDQLIGVDGNEEFTVYMAPVGRVA
ncbi:MAG: hypothetical protein JJE30_08485 [Desulfuromonadales bacterium]|nr:hypothetical protein [Desulfuromonadales bacterium]